LTGVSPKKADAAGADNRGRPAYGHAMRMKLVLTAVAAALAVPAAAQLVGEAIADGERECRYANTRAYTSDRNQLAVRIPLGRSCPWTAPPTPSITPMPPTAALLSQSDDAEERVCTYEQGGESWRRVILLRFQCPLAGGMVRPEMLYQRREPGARR